MPTTSSLGRVSFSCVRTKSLARPSGILGRKRSTNAAHLQATAKHQHHQLNLCSWYHHSASSRTLLSAAILARPPASYPERGNRQLPTQREFASCFHSSPLFLAAAVSSAGLPRTQDPRFKSMQGRQGSTQGRGRLFYQQPSSWICAQWARGISQRADRTHWHVYSAASASVNRITRQHVRPVEGGAGMSSVTAPVNPECSGSMMIIDGTALLFRAYFRVRGRLVRSPLEYNPEAEQTTPAATEDLDARETVFAFLDILVSLLLDWTPSHVAVALDHPGRTFRDEMYESYKNTRSPMPESICKAVPWVEAALKACGLTLLKIPGVEADDVIATLATQSLTAGFHVQVVSPDKDFFQLLGPSLSLLRPQRLGSSYRSSNASFGGPQPEGPVSQEPYTDFVSFKEDDFRQKFRGLAPHLFVDIMSLSGDKSDDVPGARGIGEKTAPKLIERFGSLDELLRRVEDITEKRYREAILRDQESILLSRRLVELKKDVVLGVSLRALVLKPPRDGGGLFWELMNSLEPSFVRIRHLRGQFSSLWAS